MIDRELLDDGRCLIQCRYLPLVFSLCLSLSRSLMILCFSTLIGCTADQQIGVYPRVLARCRALLPQR